MHMSFSRFFCVLFLLGISCLSTILAENSGKVPVIITYMDVNDMHRLYPQAESSRITLSEYIGLLGANSPFSFTSPPRPVSSKTLKKALTRRGGEHINELGQVNMLTAVVPKSIKKRLEKLGEAAGILHIEEDRLVQALYIAKELRKPERSSTKKNNKSSGRKKDYKFHL